MSEVCDICNTPGMGTNVSADQMRKAVFQGGFNPFQLKLLRDYSSLLGLNDKAAYENWKNNVVAQDTTDWNICPNCLSMLKPYLKDAQKVSLSKRMPIEQTYKLVAESKGDQPLSPPTETVMEVPKRKRWQFTKQATILLALVVVMIVSGGVWITSTRSNLKTEDSEVTSTTAIVAITTEVTSAIAVVATTTEVTSDPAVIAPTTKVTVTSTIESPTIMPLEDNQSASKFDWKHNPKTDHYYALTETGMSWDMLEALAIQTGGHLVSINNAAEEEWLYSTFGSTMFWIGLTDYPDEGEFRWTSGEPVTYIKWCSGEPTDTAGGAGSEDAVHAIPWAQCWNDEPTWVTEFWDPDNQKNIPSYPGVIEVETPPSPGWNEWRSLAFMFPNPQIWKVSGDNRYIAIKQHETDAFAWAIKKFEGDLMVSLDLESAEKALDLDWNEMQDQFPYKDSGCIIIYGDGQEFSYGSLIFCVDWDGYYLHKHTIYHDDEPLAFVPSRPFNKTDRVYSVTIKITDDLASMYVNDDEVLSTFLDTEEINRSGRIGLFRNWAEGEITFSNIQIKTHNNE